jgi:hypothetical protein
VGRGRDMVYELDPCQDSPFRSMHLTKVLSIDATTINSTSRLSRAVNYY